MLHVNFNTYNNYVTDSLHQWDLNQDLVINGLGLSAAPEIHFANANMDRAIVRQTTLEGGVITVRIPNSLLQAPLTIKAYVGIYEGDTFKVIETIEIPVIAKTKPADYVIEDSDEEIYSFKALENDIANARKDMLDKCEAIRVEMLADVGKATTVINARVDNIIAHNNDTNGNTELTDIRIGADGTVYTSAGEAVRGQVNGLSSEVVDLKKIGETLLYFEEGKIPTVNGATITFVTGSNLACRGTEAVKIIPLSEILQAAKKLSNLTVDESNGTVRGDTYVMTYNTITNTVNFRDSYVKGKTGDIILYAHHYASADYGLLVNWQERKELKQLGEQVENLNPLVKLSDPLLYFANGYNPTISDVGLGVSMVKFKDNGNLVCRGTNGETTITVPEILQSAKKLAKLTVDENNKTIKGDTFVMTYNTISDTIVFRDSYANGKTGDIVLYAHHYNSADYGLLIDWQERKELKELNEKVNANPHLEILDSDIVKTYDELFNNSNDTDTMFYLSDTHIMGFNGTLTETEKEYFIKFFDELERYAKVVNPDTIICGGDWLNNKDTQAKAKWKLNLVASACKNLSRFKFVTAIGNHDINEQGYLTDVSGEYNGSFDNGVLNNIFGRDTDTRKTYFSYKTNTTRYYVLDTGKAGKTAMDGYKWEQLHWFANALKSNNDEHIMIVMHIFSNDMSEDTSGNNFGSAITPMSATLMSLITAYNNKTSVTIDNISYDFSKTVGTVHSIFTGHTHYDTVYMANDNLPVVCIKNATNYGVGNIIFDMGYIDYDNKVLSLIRVNGGGTNRTVNLR